MKLNFTILSIFVFCFFPTHICHAQTVLQSVNIPDVGATWSNKTITDTTIQPGQSGSNQTWNFSNYFINPTVLSESYVSPTGNGNDSLFPSANLKVTSFFGTEDYFIRSANDLQYLGSKSNTIEIKISNVQKLLSVPLAFGDSVNNIPVTGTGYQGYALTGFISVKADGSGTLNLFSGSFLNSLRVVTDINLIEGEGTGLDTYIHITRYAWYTSNYRAPVFQISLLDIDGPLGSSHQKITTVSTLTTDIAHPEPSLIFPHIFPNPVRANSSISIKMDNSVSSDIILDDITGRFMKKYYAHKLTADGTTEINLSGLPKGIYFITVSGETKVYRQRLIIE